MAAGVLAGFAVPPLAALAKPLLAPVVVVASTALVPFTLPPLALALLDLKLAISLPEFMLRLAVLVGGAFLVAGVVRRVVPKRTLASWREAIDGLAVLNLFVFAL